MAVIEERGDNKDQFRARVRKRGHKEVSQTFSKEADAIKWAMAVEVDMERGVFFSSSKAQTMTFQDLAKRYLHEVTPTKRSAPSERSRIAVLIDRFGPLFLSTITREMVGDFRAERLATPALLADRLRKEKPRNVSSRIKSSNIVARPRMLSAQSVIHELNTLSTMIEHSRREWGVQLRENPAHVSKPRRADSRTRRISELEMHWLERAAVESTAPGLRQIIVLAVETTMRLGELIGLRWENIDLTRRTAHLVDTKNRESRTVALSTIALGALWTMEPAQGGKPTNGRVFHWAKSDSFQKSWKRCVVRAQAMHAESVTSESVAPVATICTNLRFHDIRHEGLSRLFELGLNPFEAASMSGHKSMQMLKRYTHPEASRVAAKLR